MPAPTVRLTPEQIAFFQREGYLSLPALTTREEIDVLRGIYDRLFERRAGREEGNQFDLAGTDEEGKEAALPQILAPRKYAPELNDTLLRANAAVIAAQLGGPECIFRGDHAINKPPRSGAATPWHQDEAYWGDASVYDAAFSIWVPFQEATVENGCMQFIPGSQRFEVFTHHSIGHDPRVHGLEIDPGQTDLSRAVACPLPAGGCTIHGTRVLHYTGPNLSAQPRRAYIMIFHTPEKKLATPRNFYWNHQKHTAREERARQARAAAAPATT